MRPKAEHQLPNLGEGKTFQKERCRRTPRLKDRPVSPEKREGMQRSSAGKMGVVSQEKFSSPYGAVRAISRTVQDNSQSRFLHGVFEKAACQVSMMMLHRNCPSGIFGRYFKHLRSGSCGEILRVEVVGEVLRTIAEKVEKVAKRALIKAMGSEIFKISQIGPRKKGGLLR